MHEDAHGRLPGTILEVDPDVPLNAFLGAFPPYPPEAPHEAPVMRAILFTDLCGSVEQTSRLGDLRHHELVRAHDKIMRQRLAEHCGRAVKNTGDGMMAAFTSAGCAVTCAIEAQRAFGEHNEDALLPLDVKIGISAGEPVTDEHDDLFGASVQLAARLCDSAAAGEIAVSLVVRELCIGKRFRFEPRESLELKGLTKPTTTYRVLWRDAHARGSSVEGCPSVSAPR
jgi:class 3 adenylate cyclase